jgi:hypothetical protein
MIVCIAGLAVYLTAPRPVFACSCLNVVYPTCRAFAETPLVFVATAHVDPHQRLSEAISNPDGSVTVIGSEKPAYYSGGASHIPGLSSGAIPTAGGRQLA